MTRERIATLVLVFVAATVLVGARLWHLAVDRHDVWLERSYRNRWAFRDVPSKRGTITDRSGIVVATDVPGFDLELQYRAFRRRHPVGLALHGANLLREFAARADRFVYPRPEQFELALDDLLAVPVTWLDPRPFDEDASRDLRFYVGGLVAALAEASPSLVRLRLWRLAGADRPGSVADHLDELLRSDRVDVPREGWNAALRARFVARVDQLRELDSRLAAHDGTRTSFWAFLAKRHDAWLEWCRYTELGDDERNALRDEDWWTFVRDRELGLADWRAFAALDEAQRSELLDAWGDVRRARRGELTDPAAVPRLPWNEERPRVMRSALPYRTAAWLGMLRELHPGLLLRPTVRRERPIELRDPGATVDSVVPYVGRVSPFWKTDGDDVTTEHAKRVFDGGRSSEFFREFTDELPGDYLGSLESQARGALRNYFANRGRVGRGGVEAALDAVLSGDPGLRLIERDKRGGEQQMFRSLDVAPGQDVELTIDLELQHVVERVVAELDGARERAMAVVDARSGDVLALVGRSRRPEWDEARWSLAATYPTGSPDVGSLVKPFILLEHLDAQRHGRTHAPPHAFRPCVRRFGRSGGVLLRCGGVHGELGQRPVSALGWSCNFYFFTAARGLGPNGVRRALARAGWLQASQMPSDGVPGPAKAPASFQADVPGLPAGLRATPKLRPAQWPLEKIGIGYGVEASVLYVARAYAGLATGVLPTVRLVRDGNVAAGVPLGVHPDDLAIAQRGLEYCVERGTARKVDGLRAVNASGKTGTAEISKAKDNNAWFAGWVGDGVAAQLAFAAVAYRVPDGEHGGDVSGEMVARVLRAIREDAELEARYLP